MSIAKALMDELDKSLKEIMAEDQKVGFLDTGLPELNLILSGDFDSGFTQGKMVEIFGAASSGKTFISTMAMIATQKQGGIAFFADHERSFHPKFAEQLGLDLHSGQFKHLKPKTFESSIDAFVQTAQLIRAKGLPMDVPCIWVFDSVASMIPQSKFYDDKGEIRGTEGYKMNDSLALPKATSQGYPILKQVAEDYNFTVLLLNQTRQDPTCMFGDPTKTPGGKSAEFYADTRISLGRKDLSTGTGKSKEIVGFEIKAKTVKNKLTRPLQVATWQIRFNPNGGLFIDLIASTVDFLVRIEKIKKEGTRVTWGDKKIYQSQLVELLRKEEDGMRQLLDLLPKKGTYEASELTEKAED